MTTGLLSPKFHDEWGNLQNGQTLAIGQNEERFDAGGVAAPSVEAATISRSWFRPLVAALGQTQPRARQPTRTPLLELSRSSHGVRANPTARSGRLPQPTELASLLADRAEQDAAARCAGPVNGGCLQARDGPGAPWALVPGRSSPCESSAQGQPPLRLTDGMSWRRRYAWLPRCAADRSWRPYSPRWCENYAHSVCATVGGLRAGDRAPATPACGCGSSNEDRSKVAACGNPPGRREVVPNRVEFRWRSGDW